MTKKYEFTGETKNWLGVTLRQIRLVVDIAAFGLTAGTIGGWIEKEENLPHVSGNAFVSGNARVSGNAHVSIVNITAIRTDGYTFSVCASPDGPRIIAGCRYFTYEQAREHWTKTRGGTKLGDESLLLVAHLEAMAKINGLDVPCA